MSEIAILQQLKALDHGWKNAGNRKRKRSGLTEPLHQKSQRKNACVLNETSDIIKRDWPSLLVKREQYRQQYVGHYQRDLGIPSKCRIRNKQLALGGL